MDENVTKRIAVKHIDFDKVPLEWIFKIFENVCDSKLVSLGMYLSKSKDPFAVAEFKDRESSNAVYNFCDGMVVEDTHETFDLSFIPDSFKLGEPLSVCTSSKNFKFYRDIRSKNEIPNTLEMSEENDCLDSEIPESLRQQEPQPVLEKKSVAKEKSNFEEILEKEPSAEESDDFQFNAGDERFSKLLNDTNYMIDASSDKFRKEPQLKKIIEEKRNRDKNTQK